MIAFVYIWNDKLTGRMYIGSHKGNPTDGYICSSKIVLEQMEKRPNDWKRVIVAECKDFASAVHLETLLLKKIDAAHNPKYYNMHNGDGLFYCKEHTDITKNKLKNRIPWNKGKKTTKQKQKEQIILSNKSRIWTKEARDKIAQANKNRKWTQESRNKVSQSLLGNNRNQQWLQNCARNPKGRFI